MNLESENQEKLEVDIKLAAKNKIIKNEIMRIYLLVINNNSKNKILLSSQKRIQIELEIVRPIF